MTTRLITAPTGNAVSLTSAKDHLVIDHTADDFLITTLINAATSHVENILNRRLLTQTWTLYTDEWPDEYFTLPYGQLQTVTSVVYTDSDGDDTTLDAGEYIVDTDAEPGRVVLGYNKTWPTVTLYPSNPIAIQFVCGYGDEDDIPYPIKSAILLYCGDLYAHRESVIVGQSVADIPGHIMNLLWPYRLWGAM